MDVNALVQRIQNRPDYAGQIEHIEILPERMGQFADPGNPLPACLNRLLQQRGINQLYTHQVAALEAARSGEDQVIVTGTASGKTLCYHLPVMESLLADADARALHLFPTKALAQDQLKGILELVSGDEQVHKSIRPGVYDGDTPTAQRRRIRNESNLVLSNPDMLHASILPYHPKWATLLADLKYVVIDEVHSYRGILGAHVSAVLRRLARICEHYGSRPQFIATSATIANPGELVSKLIDREVTVIDIDGSPRGAKQFVMWNPAPIGADSLARRGANDDAVTWLTEAMHAGGQALVFTKTRQATELVQRYAKEEFERDHSPLANQVRAYRGGYLPNDRREIEQDLFSGKLRGAATTNALELGIDVGSLDVAIMAGYPGTIASCWQQAGRSGRRHDASLAVLLAGNDPVDQYLLRHPEYFFSQSPESAVVDPDNPYVLAKHLKAAAFELPLIEEDFRRFGPLAEAIAEILHDEQQLSRVIEQNQPQYFCPGGQNPTVGVSLRHMSDNTFSIVCMKQQRWSRDLFASGSPPTVDEDHEVIGNVDSISAPELVYPEAVYLHRGETFFVRELDLNGKVAYVERRECDYYTQAVLEHNVLVTKERAQSDDATSLSARCSALLGYGEVDVSWQTVAFKKIKFGSKENIGLGPVDIPAQSLATTALWLMPDEATRIAMKADKLRASEGVAGLRNLAVVALPLVAMCDSRDLGGVVDAKNFGHSTVILYDRYPGGLGYAEKGFQRITDLLTICLQMVSDCPCEAGCPSCVGLPDHAGLHSDPDLKRGHPMPSKRATIRLLELLLGEGAGRTEQATNGAVAVAAS